MSTKINSTVLFSWVRDVLSRLILKIRLYFVDTYIVSYPKSGRTWVRFFLSVYLSEKFTIPLRLDWYYLTLPRAIKRFHFTHLNFKVDSIDEVEKSLLSLKGKNVLFLVRDPRDVVVSFYFYRKHRQAYEGFQSYDIGTYIRDHEYGLSLIVEYMNFVYSHKDICKNFKIVRYEDLKNPDKSRELFKEMLAFIGQEDVDPHIFENAYKKSEFENMQKAERSKELDDERLRAKNDHDENALHMRRGKVGGYADYFSVEDTAFADTEMKKLHTVFGYQ